MCSKITSLTIDNATSKRLYGHYTRILVDMDCSKKLYYEILVEREGFSFPMEVVYEWMPDYCTHCQNLGHLVTNCRWLYPKKDANEPVDKGKAKVLVQKTTWVPAQTNPTRISSSNVFEAQAVTNTKGTKPAKDTADNSFSFALQNVVDQVPQRTLPIETEQVPQDAALPVEGDGGHSGSATRSLVVPEIQLVSAEQNMEQEQLSDDDVMAANLSEHGANLSADAYAGGEVSAANIPDSSDDDVVVTVVIDGGNTSANIVCKAHTNPLFERAEGMTYTNPRIQSNLDLWQKVKEYDQRAADNPPFVPVLSKKQQQMLRKHQFDGKPPYQTLSTGDTSTTPQ